MPRFELSCPACGHLEPARPHTRRPFTCPACEVTTLKARAGRFQPARPSGPPPLVSARGASPGRP